VVIVVDVVVGAGAPVADASNAYAAFEVVVQVLLPDCCWQRPSLLVSSHILEVACFLQEAEPLAGVGFQTGE